MKVVGRVTLILKVFTLFLVLFLAGCSSMEYIQVETDTTEAIYEAASDLLKSHEDGITVDALLSDLYSKFPGLKAANSKIGSKEIIKEIIINYQGIDYIIKCEMSLSNDKESAVVTGIISVQTPIAMTNVLKTENVSGAARITEFVADKNAFRIPSHTTIRIPSHIKGEPVVLIGENAFREKGIEGVTIPYMISYIGFRAFAENQLISVDFPNSLDKTGIYINFGAFSNNQITSLTIPVSIKWIGPFAFEGNQLENLTIRTNTIVGHGAFINNKLKNVTLSMSRDLYIPSDSKGSLQYNDGIIGALAFYGNQIESLTLGGQIAGIGMAAFLGNQLENVSIPNSITRIGDSAFEGNKIINLSIGRNVTNIGRFAFRNNRLEKIIIPNNVTYIGTGAFDNNLIESVTIPQKVSFIGGAPFGNNPKLTEINVHPKNKNFSSIEGVLYNKNADTIIQWPAGISNVTIPDTVSKIGVRAFSGNQLTGITIAESVTEIQNGAFANNQLTSVTISQAVTKIGHGSFSNNPRLREINVSQDNPNFSAENGILYNKNKTVLLQWPSSGSDVTVPNNVTDIGERAFSGNQLTNINIGNNVTRIGFAAFEGNRLERVTIPNNVTEVADRAFFGNQLASLTISNNVTRINRSAFCNNQLTNVTIPNSVTHIMYKAFADNQLSGVIIPNQVTFIGERAFAGNNLTRVSIPESVRSIGSDAFAFNKLTQINIGADVNIGTQNAGVYYRESEEAIIGGEDALIIQNEAIINMENTQMVDINRPDNSSYFYFRDFYIKNYKRAGIYTYNETDKKWSFVSR